MGCVGPRRFAGSSILRPLGGDFSCPALVDEFAGLGSAPQSHALQAGSISETTATRLRDSLCGVRTRRSLVRAKQLRLFKLSVTPGAALAA